MKNIIVRFEFKMTRKVMDELYYRTFTLPVFEPDGGVDSEERLRHARHIWQNDAGLKTVLRLKDIPRKSLEWFAKEVRWFGSYGGWDMPEDAFRLTPFDNLADELDAVLSSIAAN